MDPNASGSRLRSRRFRFDKYALDDKERPATHQQRDGVGETTTKLEFLIMNDSHFVPVDTHANA